MSHSVHCSGYWQFDFDGTGSSWPMVCPGTVTTRHGRPAKPVTTISSPNMMPGGTACGGAWRVNATADPKRYEWVCVDPRTGVSSPDHRAYQVNSGQAFKTIPMYSAGAWYASHPLSNKRH